MSDPKDRPTFRHYRLLKPDGSYSPRGGVTLYYQPFNELLAVVGVAVCSSKDNFCKKKGRAIAKGRAQSLVEHDHVLVIKKCLASELIKHPKINELLQSRIEDPQLQYA